MPTLLTIGWWIVALCVILLIPNSLTRHGARWAAPPLLASSFVLGGILWLWGLLVTYWLWGWVGLIVGLLFAGIGVVPLAIIAAAINGLWEIVLQLIIFAALVFGTRFLGAIRMEHLSREKG